LNGTFFKITLFRLCCKPRAWFSVNTMFFFYVYYWFSSLITVLRTLINRRHAIIRRIRFIKLVVLHERLILYFLRHRIRRTREYSEIVIVLKTVIRHNSFFTLYCRCCFFERFYCFQSKNSLLKYTGNRFVAKLKSNVPSNPVAARIYVHRCTCTTYLPTQTQEKNWLKMLPSVPMYYTKIMFQHFKKCSKKFRIRAVRVGHGRRPSSFG